MGERLYQIEIRWVHHRDGPQRTTLKQTATSIRRAINNGLQAFFTEQKHSAQRTKQRHYLDAHKYVRVEAVRVGARKP